MSKCQLVKTLISQVMHLIFYPRYDVWRYFQTSHCDLCKCVNPHFITDTRIHRYRTSSSHPAQYISMMTVVLKLVYHRYRTQRLCWYKYVQTSVGESVNFLSPIKNQLSKPWRLEQKPIFGPMSTGTKRKITMTVARVVILPPIVTTVLSIIPT